MVQILPQRYIVTILVSCHMTSSVTWRYDPQWVVSYRWSTV